MLMYSRNSHRRTCIYKNLEAEISSFSPLNKKPKGAVTGIGSCIMGFILCNIKKFKSRNFHRLFVC